MSIFPAPSGVVHARSSRSSKSPIPPPGSPFGPCGPVAPAGPGGPEAPAGPAGPAGPVEPAAPCGPAGPAGPVAPAGPAGPVAPTGPGGPAPPFEPELHVTRRSFRRHFDASVTILSFPSCFTHAMIRSDARLWDPTFAADTPPTIATATTAAASNTGTRMRLAPLVWGATVVSPRPAHD